MKYDRYMRSGKLQQLISTSSSSSERQQPQAAASSSSTNVNRTGGTKLQEAMLQWQQHQPAVAAQMTTASRRKLMPALVIHCGCCCLHYITLNSSCACSSNTTKRYEVISGLMHLASLLLHAEINGYSVRRSILLAPPGRTRTNGNTPAVVIGSASHVAAVCCVTCELCMFFAIPAIAAKSGTFFMPQINPPTYANRAPRDRGTICGCD